ncbi:MAG: GTPase HflX [Candidatus Sumerlaeota bacterium]|nr:GTPase HflX [Candidatus Sumerlaeota bacterium]
MFEVETPENSVERAYLVGLRTPKTPVAEVEEHVEELARLTDTMGMAVVGRAIVPLSRFHPALLVGEGKADEIMEECKSLEVDCVIFDDDLSPSQQRNWEKRSELVVIDRREVILDIFAQHARTREARLQAQLARLEYSLPRLRRAWTHLERQRLARGARGGSGEMQLETDQRIVRNQIAQIKHELAEVRRQRATRRRRREVKPAPVAAIVGYTNAGKSTLLRTLTGADVLIEDKLFATLDPTTRRVALPNNQELLLVDTVGFIRKLPHDLVASFKATLEEAALADVLIHVVDASHPSARAQMDAANAVLKELDAYDKPTVLALNKIDRVDDPAALAELSICDGLAVRISARTGQGLDELLEALARLSAEDLERLTVEAPPDRYDIVSLLHREGKVLGESYGPAGARIRVDFPRRLRHIVEPFVRK